MQPEFELDQIAPELISTGAKAIVNNAKRLGLTWTLTLATVTNASPVEAIVDGDSVPIGMVSMVGFLSLGQRVYVIQVPPSGNFIVGFVSAARSYYGIGNQTGTLGTTTPEAAIPFAAWAQEPSVVIQRNQIVKVTVNIVLFQSASTNTVGSVRVRKGSVTVSGTLLGRWACQLVTQASLNASSFTLIGYFKNTSGSVVDTPLSITLELVGGAPAISVYSDSQFPLIVEVSPHSTVGIDPVFDARLASV